MPEGRGPEGSTRRGRARARRATARKAAEGKEAPTTAKSAAGKATQIGGGWKPGADIDVAIRERFQGILSGKIKRFSPELKERKKQSMFTSIMARKRAEQKSLSGVLAERGVSRGGVMARGETELHSAALETYGEGINQMEIEEAMAEFDDRNMALDKAQKWLDSRRNYELQKEQIQAQREATAAQISLGYAQIKAGKENARVAAGAARAGLQLGRESFEFQKQKYEDSKIDFMGERMPPGVFDRKYAILMGGP